MKKILYTFLALTLVLPAMASAATFSFSPSTGTFTEGEAFNVDVYVNPSSGESITTAKLSTLFSSSNLEVVSFVIESGWIQLQQPGYDSLDNASGVLIKTGGFPSKVQSQKKFGALTLKAKSAGTATINLQSNSLLLDTTNVNKYISSTGATFVVVAPTSVPVVEVEDESPVAPKVNNVVNTEIEDTEVEDITTTIDDTASTTEDQLAAAGEADADSNDYIYYVIGILVILAGGLVWYLKDNFKR